MSKDDDFLDDIDFGEDKNNGFTDKDESIWKDTPLEELGFRSQKQISDEKKARGDNSPTREFDVLKDGMMGVHAERFNRLLVGMSDREFARAYPYMLQYAIPKLKAIELPREQEEPTPLQVVFIDKNFDEK